MKVCDTHC